MHCKDWEERLALHVGGDLPADESSAVERHLAVCSGCQVLWSGMKQSLELLQGAHAEPLPPASYTAVRGRVLAELAAGRRTWWRSAAALAALAALLLVWPERRVPPLPPVALAHPPRPPVYQPSHGRKGVAPGHKSKPAPRQPLLVRLVTDDPDIVIYWIAD